MMSLFMDYGIACRLMIGVFTKMICPSMVTYLDYVYRQDSLDTHVIIDVHLLYDIKAVYVVGVVGRVTVDFGSNITKCHVNLI